nr:beta-D-glucosyl crocetin beta-1,6-glucosyltransferase-like [Tanacetum cinerariifolium]
MQGLWRQLELGSILVEMQIDLGRDADGRLKREEMAIVVRNMVVGGGHIREKVKELGEIIKKQGDEDLDMLVINSLVKLCERKNYLRNMETEIRIEIGSYIESMPPYMSFSGFIYLLQDF